MFRPAIVYITDPCIFCHETHAINLSPEGYAKWQKGEYVSVAFPELTPEEQEMLVSGTCGKCWDQFMVDKEDS